MPLETLKEFQRQRAERRAARRQRRTTERLGQRLGRLTDLAAREGTPEPSAPLSALEKISDVLLRPNFATAGFFDSLLNEGGSIGDALKRAGSEFFSGIGGLKGQKETFGDVLEDLGLGRGPTVSEFIPFIFNESGKGWKFKRDGAMDFTSRGALGFALDIAADPLTYVSSGTSRAARQLLRAGTFRKEIVAGLKDPRLRKLAESGRVPLTKPGLKEWTKFFDAQKGVMGERQRDEMVRFLKTLGDTKRVRREIRRIKAGTGTLGQEEIARVVERTGKFGPWEIPGVAFDLHEATYVAMREQATRSLLHMADQGFSGLIDPGGLKFFGKSLIAGEHFTKIGLQAERLLRTMEGRGGGAGLFVRGLREIDSLFKATLRAARKVPGLEGIKGRYRAQRRDFIQAMARTVDGLVPPEWAKMTIESGEHAGMKLHEFIARHIDNPQKYLAKDLPGDVGRLVNRISDFFQEIGNIEARVGLLDAERVRVNYFPHMYKNSFDELRRLGKAMKARGGAVFERDVVHTRWREIRAFNTFDEAQQVAQELGIKLEPVFDLREVLGRRARGHAEAVAFRNHEVRMFKTYGLAKEVVARKVFDHAFPELHKKVGAEMFGRAEARAAVEVGYLLGQGTAVSKAALAKLSPEAKALYFMGRIRMAESLEEIEKLVARHGDEIAASAPGVPEIVRNVLKESKRDVLGAFNEPMGRVTGIKGLEGVVAPRVIADDLARMKSLIVDERDVKAGIKVWDYANDTFKVAVTAPWPGFHMRNAMSNVWQNFLDIGISAFDPVRFRRVLSLMRGGDGTMVTRAGRRYTYGELRTMMKEYNILQHRGAMFEQVTATGRRDFVRENPLVRFGMARGTEIENQARAMNFMTHIERGLDPLEAALRVQSTLFDYENLSPFHKQFLRRIVPFPTWMLRNVELQAKKLVTEPGRVAISVKGADWRQKGPDEDMLPEYLRGRFKIKLHERGKHVFLTNIDMPFASAMEDLFGRGTSDADMNIFRAHLSKLNPLLKALVEGAQNKSLFTGRPLDQRERVRGLAPLFRILPKPAKDWIEFDETDEGDVSISGTKAYLLFKSWALARVYSTVRASDDLDSWALAVITGLRFQEFDLTRAQQNTLRARIQRLEKDLKRRGKLRAFEVVSEVK